MADEPVVDPTPASEAAAEAPAPPDPATLQAELETARAEAKAAKDRLATFDPLASSLPGGDKTIIAAADAARRLFANPDMAKHVQKFLQTGQVPREYQDPYLPEPTPEDPRDVKIRQLEQALGATQAQVNARLGEAELDRHFQRIKTEWGEEAPAIMEAIGREFKALEARNDPALGNPDVLRDLIDITALRTVKPRLKEIGRRAYEAELQAKKAASTGTIPSRPGAPRDEKPNRKMSVMEIFRRNAAELGVDPDKLKFYGKETH